MGERPFRGALLLFIVLMLPGIATGCDRGIRGEFGWSSTDDRGLSEREREILVESEFRIARHNIYFYNYETIWWIYRIDGGSYDADDFMAALYEDNVTPQPVEFDLRHVRVERQGSAGFIRQYYEPLSPGNYILKIAYGANIVDEVSFQVIPPEGPGVSDEADTGEEEPEQDEILRYSR